MVHVDDPQELVFDNMHCPDTSLSDASVCLEPISPVPIEMPTDPPIFVVVLHQLSLLLLEGPLPPPGRPTKRSPYALADLS